MNTFLNDILMNEAGDFDGAGGGLGEESGGEGGEFLETDGNENVGGEETPSPFLRDLTEDQVYDMLNESREFPKRVDAVRDQLFGRMGPVVERQNQLEKALQTRVTFNADAVTKALEGYDNGDLAKVLVPALQEALQVSPLDETALSPFLGPALEKMQEQMGRQLVLSQYTPQRLTEIIPEADQNGQFNPQGQLQKDFVDWYAQQGYETQQNLSTFSAEYVHAMRNFEEYARQKSEERAKAEKAKASRLNGGRQPSARGRASQTPRLRTRSEGFNSVFEE